MKTCGQISSDMVSVNFRPEWMYYIQGFGLNKNKNAFLVTPVSMLARHRMDIVV